MIFRIFLSISLSKLNRSHQWQRASWAQSLQNVRAQEQNREHRALGLALKSGLVLSIEIDLVIASFSSSMLHNYTTCFVSPSIHLSVGPSYFTFFGFLPSLASLFLPKWLMDLKYHPCPPKCDWSSCVPGLVYVVRAHLKSRCFSVDTLCYKWIEPETPDWSRILDRDWQMDWLTG